MLCPLDFGGLDTTACAMYVLLENLLFGNFDGASNIMLTLVLMLRPSVNVLIINK